MLTDTCDILRRGASLQVYGGKPSYTPHLFKQPCRLIEKTQTGFNTLTAQFQVTTVYKLMLRHETDVLEGDRITNVLLYGNQDSDKFPLSQQEYEIEGGALPHRGAMARHKTVTLKKVS